MGDKDMNETRFLFQPRGGNTAWLFRMATPAILIGRDNPRTGKPYRSEIRESLGGVSDLTKARELRDLHLGEIRREQEDVIRHSDGDMGQKQYERDQQKVARWLKERKYI